MTHLTPLNIPRLLRKYGLRPSKALGQNFLVDEEALQTITSAAGVGPQDTVLEVGPGLGSLTRHLAASARAVIAVELDGRFLPVLQDNLAGYDNIRLVHGDILKLQPSTLIDSSSYLVVANIPYNITSALFRHLLESSPQPARIVLTIQQEVAERICALPGEMSLLSLSVQVYGRPRILAHFPSTAFYPAPKVDSALLSVAIYPQPIIPAALLDTFFSLTKAGFSQRRKTLRNSLSAGMRIAPTRAEELLNAAQIDPMRRAETLDLFEWERVSQVFSSGAHE